MSLTRDYLRRQENPYAKLSIEEELDQRRAYIRLLQNPYATLEVSDDPLSMSESRDTAKSTISDNVELQLSGARETTISQADFEGRLRLIFAPYMPLVGTHTRLHPEYRDFIIRAKKKNAHNRLAILRELERYDLSALGDIKPYLNRERETALRAKLAAILEKYDA